MRFRRGPFDDLVERQLELLAEDAAADLQEAAQAEAAWVSAGRDDAEEAYGDFQLVVDAIAERLLDVREAYAATIDEERVEAYRTRVQSGGGSSFQALRVARRRPRALILEPGRVGRART